MRPSANDVAYRATHAAVFRRNRVHVEFRQANIARLGDADVQSWLEAEAGYAA